MEAVTILPSGAVTTSEYDAEADVLYISVGDPRPALGVDIGDGLVVRFDEAKREVAGLTIIGFRERLARGMEG
ncbi:MAG: DUF2283 domain-containing protein [Chloroflexota bacterium]|nr:DUF2283 domain-containing protein [Chloroflexota bacterium]